MTSLDFSGPVILVGAGPVHFDDFALLRRYCDAAVAVDGGYDTLKRWGMVPDAVLGDLDSVRSNIPESLKTLKISDQDTTDFDKALRVVRAPIMFGAGFLGGRMDHTLAAMHSLVTAHDRKVVLVGSEDIVFAAPLEWRITMPPGTRISFYPVRRVRADMSTGLRWPLDGLVLEGGVQTGVSNETSEAVVETKMSSPGVVTILPRQCLPNVVTSLN